MATSSTSQPTGDSMARRTVFQLAGPSVPAAAAPSALGQPQPASRISDVSSSARPSATAAYGYDTLYDASQPYILHPGPHLFLDWRYVSGGGIGWRGADGKPIHYFASKEPKGVTFSA